MTANPKYLFFDASFPVAIGQIGVADRYYDFAWETRQDLAAHQTRLVDRMLATAGVTFDDLDLIGVGIGPGSLTGLRMTIGFFRTLARYGGRPLLGVSLFDWAVRTLELEGRTGFFRLAVPGPLKGQFITEVTLPEPGPIPAARIRFSPVETVQAFDQLMTIRQHLPDRPSLELSPKALHQLMRSMTPASGDDLLKVVPLYVIPSQAEINWEKRQQA